MFKTLVASACDLVSEWSHYSCEEWLVWARDAIVRFALQAWQDPSSLMVELAILFSVLYLAHYLLFVVRRPTLHYQSHPFNRRLVDNVSKLTEPFWPTLWLAGGYRQTVWSIARCYRHRVQYDRCVYRNRCDGKYRQFSFEYPPDAVSFDLMFVSLAQSEK
jgi:hypothetical protein